MIRAERADLALRGFFGFVLLQVLAGHNLLMPRLLESPFQALAAQLKHAPPRRIIGLAGVPGSGKSTLAARWCREINAQYGPHATAVLGMDGFHLTRAQLAQMPDAEAAFARRGAPWTFDAPALAARLQLLRENCQSVAWPDFQHEIGDPVENAFHIAPEVILVLVEGLYLLHQDDGWDAVARQFDKVWYLDTPREIALERLLQRHISAWQITREEALWRIASNDRLNAEIVAETRFRADALVAS